MMYLGFFVLALVILSIYALAFVLGRASKAKDRAVDRALGTGSRHEDGRP